MNKERLARNNRIRFAMRQVSLYLRTHYDGKVPLKQNEKIRLFFEMQGISALTGLKKRLLEVWSGNENPHVFRSDRYFYSSSEWIELRAVILAKNGPVCVLCGDDKDPCIDHIFPRSLFKELELDEKNMQVLCRRCNSSKGNRLCSRIHQLA